MIDKNEFFNKVDKEMREIHKNAALIYAARQRREYEETKERVKAKKALRDKERAEAILQAKKDGVDPEDAAQIIDSRFREIKTEDEIIKSGTPKERAELVIRHIDTRNSFNRVPDNTFVNAVRKEVAKASAEEKGEFLYYLKEYDNVNGKVGDVRFYFKIVQLQLSILSQFCEEWKGYEREANDCTRFLNSLIYNKDIEFVGANSAAEKASFIVKDILSSNCQDWEGAALVFDEATLTFKADIEGEGRLYDSIQKEIPQTIKAMEDFKAITTAILDYCLENDLPAMPISISMLMDNAEEEGYIRSLQTDLRYFQSDLIYRKANNETITPEDEKRAIIPSYWEVERNEELYKTFKEKLNK